MPLEKLVLQYSRPLFPIPAGFHKRGKTEGEIRAILFDVYGTLFISKAGDISMARKGAEQNIIGIGSLLERFHIQKSAGDLPEQFFDEIRKEKEKLKRQGVDFPEIQIEKIWEKILNINNDDIIKQFAAEYELIVNPVYPMPHLREVLAACKENNIPMGIISNAQFYTPYLFYAFLNATLENLGFVTDFVFFSYVSGHVKPSLYMFERAAETLEESGIPRCNTLYVGNDMIKDIHCANKVGFQTALFAGDKRSLRLGTEDTKYTEISPNLVITDLLQLLDFV
jgi:putative hydrolase of the HAD superfamily